MWIIDKTARNDAPETLRPLLRSRITIFVNETATATNTSTFHSLIVGRHLCIVFFGTIFSASIIMDLQEQLGNLILMLLSFLHFLNPALAVLFVNKLRLCLYSFWLRNSRPLFYIINLPLRKMNPNSSFLPLLVTRGFLSFFFGCEILAVLLSKVKIKILKLKTKNKFWFFFFFETIKNTSYNFVSKILLNFQKFPKKKKKNTLTVKGKLYWVEKMISQFVDVAFTF